MICRICGYDTKTVLELGSSPPANYLLDNPEKEEIEYPLILEFCSNCSNIQLKDCLPRNDLYKNYLYLTPESSMLKSHYEDLTNFLLKKKYLTNQSFVLEVGSNSGNYLNYLSQYVKDIIGMDPAKNIVDIANKSGIKTICDFFSEESAKRFLSEKGSVNNIVARHCFAHNSDPHDLLKGVKLLLDKDGYVVIENAYIVNTIENNEFDQIYHEHMFYYSIKSMQKAFELNGLKIIDLFFSLIHGGSIVFIGTHKNKEIKPNTNFEKHMINESIILNNDNLLKFGSNASKLKTDLNILLGKIKSHNKTIYTYGATAKGNTLLNFCNIKRDLIPYCVDSTPIKHGKYLPCSKIKIVPEEFIESEPPDYFLLTAWNYKEEIIRKVRSKNNFSSSFIVPFPNLVVI